MPIGAARSYLPDRPRSGLRSFLTPIYPKTYIRLYGTQDLHTHTRWRAIKPLVSSVCPTGAEVVLDVGCGDGSVSFEVAKRLNRGEVIGLDVDPVTIKSTMETKEAARVKNADFRVMSASGLVDVADKSCDVVLLIDVMEHVVDDRSVAREVSRVLRPGGALVVSVPTPNYPRVFGREFHEAVGHVREGYSIERLEELLAEQQMHVEKHAYYTYPPSALVCLLYYRWLRKVRYVSVLGSPLLNLFSYLDYVWPIRRGAWACSISLVARREPN